MSIENVMDIDMPFLNILILYYRHMIYIQCSKSLETVITLIRLIMTDQR